MGQLEDMQVFIRVVDGGGIGRAAEQMGIAKSAVSRRLAELETRLGVTLINRTTRTSKLTEAGQNYYNRSLQLINDIDDLNNLTSNPDCSLNGSLRMTVPLSFGLLHLTPALDEFSKLHSELNLDINFSDNETDLIEGGFDLALRIGELENSTLKARKISPIRLSICASPAYLKEHGTPTNHEDLKKHKLLKYSIADKNGWRLIDKHGHIHTVHVKSQFSANNGEFLLAMAAANHGILTVPTFIAWKALATKELVPILNDYHFPEYNAFVVYPQTRTTSRKVRVFTDFLIERLGEEPYWDKKIP